MLPEKRRERTRRAFEDQPLPQVAVQYHHNAATLDSFMGAKVIEYHAAITHVRVSLNPAPESTLRCAGVDLQIDGRPVTMTVYFTKGIGSRLSAKRELKERCKATPLREPVPVTVRRVMIKHNDA